MRVCVVETSGTGGLIHYAYHLCRALQRSQIDTTLVTSTSYELSNLKHEFKVEPKMRLWNTRSGAKGGGLWRKIRRGWRGVQYILAWVWLIGYLRRTRPDVVLFGEIRFGFERHFLAYLRRSGLVLADVVHDVQVYDTRRNSDAVVQSSDKVRNVYNTIYRLFDVLFLHDRSNYDLFLSLYDVPAERVVEIFHATNELALELAPAYKPDALRTHLGVKPNEHVVLFFGTLNKYKGVEDLIQAFPAVVARETSARLVIAGFPGKDVDTEMLQAMARQLKVDQSISWYLDYVPNEWISSLMAMSDVMVLPYRAITQSGVLQIAYACGKPVVATRVGGLPDVIEEGKSGFLVPPQDPAALAEAVIKVLQDPELARAMGQRARELAETRYAWRVVAERMKGAFEKRLSEKQ